MDIFTVWAEFGAQIVLAIVGIWYAYETQRLRRIASKQIDVTNKQADAMQLSLELTKASFDAGLLPYLVMGIVKNSDRVLSAIAVDSPLGRIDLPAVGKVARKVDDHPNLSFEIKNVTDKIASHLFCIFFDRRNNRNYISSYILEAVGPQHQVFLPLQQEPIPVAEIIDIIRNFYEKRGDYLINSQDSSECIVKKYANNDNSHVLVMFFDLAGKLYAIPRIVTSNEHLSEFHFGKSDLIQPDPWWFAPAFGTTKDVVANAVRRNDHIA